MNFLNIKIKDNKDKFMPGEEIHGEVMWDLQKLPSKIEVKLFWFTAGQGGLDSEIVNSIELAAADLIGKQSFRFRLPLAPYSFSGNLITLRWAVDATAPPTAERSICEFVMSPSDNPIVLKSIKKPLPKILGFLSKLKPPASPTPESCRLSIAASQIIPEIFTVKSRQKSDNQSSDANTGNAG